MSGIEALSPELTIREDIALPQAVNFQIDLRPVVSFRGLQQGHR